MSLVTRAQLRFLWRARGSMLSALLGMTIGVASVVGVHLLSAQIAWRVAQQAQPVSAVDLYLQKANLNDADYFQLRKRWRDGEFPQVAALFPLLEGEVTFNNQPHLLVGTDPLATGEFRLGRQAQAEEQRVDLSGKFFSEDSVILPSGSRTVPTVELNGTPVQVLGYTAPSNTVLADLPSARSILGGDSAGTLRLTRIGVRYLQGAGPDGLVLAFLRKLFPGALSEPEVSRLTALGEHWQQVPAANQDPTQQLLRAVLFNVAALSVLALVVAWLLTYQVACHALGRRQGMFERLQSLGVSHRRLRAQTQVEGIILGAAATLLGVGLGSILANLLLTLATGADFSFGLGLSTFVWLKAVVSGVGVAGLSYWFAAKQALFTQRRGGFWLVLSKTFKPFKALKPWRVSRFILPAALAAVFCWGLLGNTLIGAFACIVVSALTLIIYLPALVDWLWRESLMPAEKQRGSSLKTLALRQVLVGRELRLGVSALALALATALGISIMVDSFRGAFLQMLDQRLADDVVVQVETTATDIETVREALKANAKLYGRGTVSLSISGVAGRGEFSDNPAELLNRFFADDAVIADSFGTVEPLVYLNESFARLQQLEAGRLVQLSGSGETLDVLIAGIFTDFGEVRPRLLLSQVVAERLDRYAELSQLYLRLPEVPDTNAETFVERVQQQLGELANMPGVKLQDQAQVRLRSIEIFEQTFAITRALTWLALLVAAVALANALAAHGLQQQGTARQLRVLGISLPNARRLRYTSTLYVAGASVLLAVPLGLVIAALLCLLVNPIAFGWSFPMRLTFAGMAWPLVGGALGALCAALLGDLLAGRRAVQTGRSGAMVSSSSAMGLLAFGVCAFLLSGLAGCGAETNEHTVPDRPAAASGIDSAEAVSAPALRVGSVLGGDADGFARATKVVPFVFPLDHGAHPEFRSEWWYLTCPLRNPETDAEFGVQFTLFRQALRPAAPSETDLWRTGQVYMAHAAVTDVAAEKHAEVTRLARGHPALAGARGEAPFAVWLEDWRLEAQPKAVGLDQLMLNVSSAEFEISLALARTKPLVLQGDRGLSYKGSSEASYYYSLPRLDASGSIFRKQRQHADQQRTETSVAGACWLDREWSTSVLADNLVGWDWFALQLDDATEFMLFQLREKTAVGQSAATQPPLDAGQPMSYDQPPAQSSGRQGKFIDANGAAVTLAPHTLDFNPLRYWQDETGARWPVEWRVRAGDRTLRVMAALDDQRMRSSIAYWEGLVWVYDGSRRVGQGYLEMTGYSP